MPTPSDNPLRDAILLKEDGFAGVDETNVSPHRAWMDKQQDSIDMRRIMKANASKIDLEVLSGLAAQVWEGGGEEIKKYLELALEDKPFA